MSNNGWIDEMAHRGTEDDDWAWEMLDDGPFEAMEERKPGPEMTTSELIAFMVWPEGTSEKMFISWLNGTIEALEIAEAEAVPNYRRGQASGAIVALKAFKLKLFPAEE